MTYNEYQAKIKILEAEISKVTNDYVNSNKIYDIGDYLKISFPIHNGNVVIRTCKVMNVYPYGGELEYFARYAWRGESNKVTIGDVCYLGLLSHRNNICGYANIDFNRVKIEVIKESDLEGIIL